MKNSFGIIYKVTNIMNNKIYIGQTIKSLETRKWGHENDAVKKKVNYPFLNAINKYGIHNVEFLGSLAEFGSINIGYKKNKPYTKLIKDMVYLVNLNDIVIGGWDICSDDLYTACKNNKVIDTDLLNQIKEDLCDIVPLPSVYYEKFIAKNQKDRANNLKQFKRNKWADLLIIKSDIESFKIKNNLDSAANDWIKKYL